MPPLKCPICSKPVAAPAGDDRRAYPFCSDRCRDVDLGRWLDGAYQVPVAESPNDDDPYPTVGRFGGRLGPGDDDRDGD